MVRGMVALSCAASSLVLATAAHAAPDQTGGPGQSSGANVSEVIVTANKREERLQKVPMSVTVVNASQLAAQDIHSTEDLVNALPALGNDPFPGGALFVRGVGTVTYSVSAEADVGIVVDGVALGNTISPLGATSLFDVSRIELLEGPQGTLFGRNSSAGILNIVSNAPVLGRFEGTAHADIATRDSQVFQAVENVPLGNSAAIRVSEYSDKTPFTYTNALTGVHTSSESAGGRARILWQPTSNLKVNIIGDYDHTTYTGNEFFSYSETSPGTFITQELAACGVTASPTNATVCTDAPGQGDIKTYGVSGEIDYSLGKFTLTSITANRWQHAIQGGDIDGIQVNLIDVNYRKYDISSFSQEFRLTSPAGERFEYVAGLYYARTANNQFSDLEGSISPSLLALGLLLGDEEQFNVVNQSYAGFFQGTFHVTDAFRLTAGARIDQEQVSDKTSGTFLPPGAIIVIGPSPPINAHTTNTDLSYRFGVEYDLLPGVMLYASYTRGYKGPAFNESPITAAEPLLVKPEIPKQYEISVKTSLFENRIAVSLAAFDTDITNFQAEQFDALHGVNVFTNVPSLKTRGVELNAFGQPLKGLTVAAGVAYVDAYYGPGFITPCGPTQGAAQGCDLATGTQSAAGRQAAFTPHWKATLSGQYERPLSDSIAGFIEGDATYTSPITYAADYDPGSTIGDYLVIGARAGVKFGHGRYSISVFGRNLTDQRIPLYRLAFGIFGDLYAHAQVLGPDSFRRVGVSLDAKF